jgi:hypothetical protein
LDSIIQNNNIQDSFPSSLLRISTHVKWTTFKAFSHSHFIIGNKNVEDSFFHLHCFAFGSCQNEQQKFKAFFHSILLFFKYLSPQMTTCKPSFIQLCFWILSSKTTLFKAFFHIHFSALDHVKSTTIQAFIHSHCGLGFCHPKRQHLRLFVIFIALQFDHHVKWTTTWKAFFHSQLEFDGTCSSNSS